MKTIRILIADDHALIYQLLKTVLDAEIDLEVIGGVTHGENISRYATELKPDIIIMDVSMPGLDGLAATRQIKALNPQIKVLAFSAYEDELRVRGLLQAGASGYISKRSAVSEIIKAIHIIMGEEMYLDSSLMHLAPLLKQDSQDSLSDRERSVLKMSVRGLANKEIAKSLGVSVKSIETYKTRINKKLDFNSRADWVRYAHARGWLHTET